MSVLVESEKSYSDLCASGNSVTRNCVMGGTRCIHKKSSFRNNVTHLCGHVAIWCSFFGFVTFPQRKKVQVKPLINLLVLEKWLDCPLGMINWASMSRKMSKLKFFHGFITFCCGFLFDKKSKRDTSWRTVLICFDLSFRSEKWKMVKFDENEN